MQCQVMTAVLSWASKVLGGLFDSSLPSEYLPIFNIVIARQLATNISLFEKSHPLLDPIGAICQPVPRTGSALSTCGCFAGRGDN
jgi:hypothetical protein